MNRARTIARIELVFAILLVFSLFRPQLWRIPGAAPALLLVGIEAVAALVVAHQLLRQGQRRAWMAALAFAGLCAVELWYVLVALTFSFMGEGRIDRPGLALIAAILALQLPVIVTASVELLAQRRE